MPFWKFEGLGNDFIVLESPLTGDPADRARRLCDRRRGIGADGVLVVVPGPGETLHLTIWNADGSEAAMCGNGVRCVAAHAMHRGWGRDVPLHLETRSGPRVVRTLAWDGYEGRFEVAMGRPDWSPGAIGIERPDPGSLISAPVEVEGHTWTLTALSMGNPHVVTFVDELDVGDLHHWGPKLERHPMFRDRTNVEFVRVVRPDRLEVLVHERGVGPTQACGTGACASLVAAACTGRADRRAEVLLPGGMLEIVWADDDEVFMTGPARLVYTGEWPVEGASGSL
jgi:diaminopimelate epimerase